MRSCDIPDHRVMGKGDSAPGLKLSRKSGIEISTKKMVNWSFFKYFLPWPEFSVNTLSYEDLLWLFLVYPIFLRSVELSPACEH